jgi:enoyl-CoA hydratase
VAQEPDDVLLVDDDGPVRWLTLHRPAALNALNEELLDALDGALAEAAADEGVHVLVVRGAGRAFSSGYDLGGYTSGGNPDAAELHRVLERDAATMLRIHDHPKPVIAQVHGYCLAGATDLMLACDLAVASDDAKFGYVDNRFGSAAVSMFLPWVVGVRKAKEMLYTGNDRVSADEALAMGLVNRVVPAVDLDATVRSLAEEIAKNEPFVVQMTKRTVNRAWDVAGFRAAQAANTEIGTLIESGSLPVRDEFRRRAQEGGLRAAFAWRDSRFRLVER